MNQERLNFRDLLEDSTDCVSTALNKRRKWSSSAGARKYHDLAMVQNHTGTLTQNLLKNLSNTKRHVSELIEKNKMTEWLKKNTIKCGSKPGFEADDPNNDSGVSLCPSADESKDASNAKSSSSLPIRKTDKKGNFRHDYPSHSKTSMSDLEGILESELSNADNNHDENEDVKEFYTPRSCWDEEKKLDSMSESINNRERIQRSSRQSGNTASRISSTVSLIQSTISSRPNSPSLDSDGTGSFILEGDDSQGLPGRARRSANLDYTSDVSVTYSNTSIIDLEGDLDFTKTSPSFEKMVNRKESKVDLPIKYPVIANSLIQLSQLKKCNQNAVSNFLNNLTSSNLEKSDLNSVPMDCNGDGRNSMPSSNCSSESVFTTPSKESLKWNFPNSNRKREEKLRSTGKDAAAYDISIKEPCKNFLGQEIETSGNGTQFSKNSIVSNEDTTGQTSCNRKPSNTEFKISYTTEGCIKKIYDEKSQRYNKTVTKTNVVNLANGDGYSERRVNVESIRDMNTHAALIYLSETLIESAQRAEMLLMQKMKEYNDLVCRDPPEKKKQDVSCQIKVEEQQQKEALFESKLHELKYKYEKEIKEKAEKILQLEIEKKKLRQALKKMNVSIVKKCDVSTGGNIDVDIEAITPRSASSESSVKDNSANGELVQALKIENNLLHTLLKEMKAELDQENATILSLAKKLEMSLGKQSGTKTKQQTEVVRKLETKLEQQEKLLKQEAMEARAVAKYVIMKYKKLIQEYKQKVKSHQETVDKLTNAIK